MKNVRFLFLFGILIFNQVFGQELKTDEFVIYLRSGRYDEQTISKLNEIGKFENYRYLANYYIDRQRKDTINYNYVEEALSRMFTSKLDSGFLSINLENKFYKDLRDYDPQHPLYEHGLRELMDLVEYVKVHQPNVKIGIYGIPYNFYWEGQKKRNADNKLEPLLNLVDYISPSLYIHYPDSQRGKESNLVYIRENLKVALEYGRLLDKPVIPYVWYLIHPSHKKYGRQIISPPEMTNYLRLIKDFEYQGIKTSGIIWWQPSKMSYKLPKEKMLDIDMGMTADDILLKYFNDNFFENW